MPTEPPPSVDPATARKVHNFVGHYMVAVAAELFKEGIPVRRVSAVAPHADDEPGEAEGYIGFVPSYARRFSDLDDFALSWTDRSGWLLDLEPFEENYRANARWLADGLVPTPARVASFMLTASLAPIEAGSAHRPFYREATDPYEPLLKQLAVYHPRSAGRVGHDDWSYRFRILQQDIYHHWIVDDLTPEDDDPTITLPVKASEARALIRALELAAAHDGYHGLIETLAADLTARVKVADTDPAAEPQPRTAARLARERKGNRN